MVFNGNKREVNITGEAYFEVVKDKTKPFHVASTGQIIEVLGTEFNVNAYTDEPATTTTLLEGSVRITAGKKVETLLPVTASHKCGIDAKYNTIQNPYAAAAWKDNRFIFGEQADIESIMRTIARWYNVNVQYNGKPSFHFGGSLPRNIALSQVLKVLENTGGVHFSINGNTVTVMP